MRYFLLGYMGSGKSTLGKALSQRLGVGFVDLDVRITEQIGQSIASYMAAHLSYPTPPQTRLLQAILLPPILLTAAANS